MEERWAWTDYRHTGATEQVDRKRREILLRCIIKEGKKEGRAMGGSGSRSGDGLSRWLLLGQSVSIMVES